MVDKIRLNEKAYGKISYDIPNSSKINLHGRKSLFAVEKIQKEKNLLIKILEASGLTMGYIQNIINFF